MVIWFIGLSGSGKTTISKKLYEQLKPSLPNLVRLDGDVLREVFGHDVDHTVNGRLKNAERLSHLTKMLSDQNIHVIAAVLSIFPEWQKWNRENIKDYAQVYLKVSLDKLKLRDNKNLYAPAFRGEIKNMVGVDIPFPEPVGSDLIVDNNHDRNDFDDVIQQVLDLDVCRKIKELNGCI